MRCYMQSESKPFQKAVDYNQAIDNANKWFTELHQNDPAYTGPGLDSTFIAWMLKEFSVTVSLESKPREVGERIVTYIFFTLRSYDNLEKLTMMKLRFG